MDLKETPYWSIWADTYTFMRTHFPAKASSEYWETTCADSVALALKYQGTPHERFCNDTLRAVLDELGRAGDVDKY